MTSFDESGRELVVAGDPACVDWSDPSGLFVPRCDLCGYVGVPREHSQARAAVRHHASGVKHRRELRRNAIARRG